MIHLLIDNQEVVLSEDMEFDINRSNPMLDKAGDYTFDIDIDLRIPSNARLYAHINRINSKTTIENRTAEIWRGTRILCRGVESILELKDSKVKIQVVSNNSELNYLYDDTTRIRELNLGTIPTPTCAIAKSVANAVYPESNYVFPVLFREDFADFCGETFNTIDNYELNNNFAYKSDDLLRPQPFLLYYIDKIVEVLGYTLGTCDIDREKYNRLIVVHGYNTLNYARMLPDWSVSEFITHVENFFNVVFYADTVNRVIDIISVEKYYQRVGTEYVNSNRIVDYDERKYNEEPEGSTLVYDNVAYKLPTSEYWSFADIKDDVYKRCAIEEKSFSGTWQESYDNKDMVIFHDANLGEEFIHYESEDGQTTYTRIVNQFKSVKTDNDTAETQLCITPAQIKSAYFTNSQGGHMFCAPIPVYFEDSLQTELSGAIRSGIQDNASDIMQVAFYAGVLHFRDISGTYNGFGYGIPMCWTTKWTQLFNVNWTFEDNEFDGWDEEKTLSLRGENGRLATELHNGISLETKKLFVVKFQTEDFIDPRKKFVIHNRLFYCKSLKYHVKNLQVETIVEGEFYPAK